MSCRALTIITLTLTVAAGVAGCGITDPYHPNRRPTVTTTSTSRSTASAAAADSGDPAPERGGTVPAAPQAAQHTLVAGAAAPTPRAALDRYARLSLNWTAADLVARERRLAALSVGQAQAQALQAAASAARDPELTRSHVTNTGQLVATATGTGAASRHWVLVSRETTTGTGDYAGLPAALHVIYAQVTPHPRRMGHQPMVTTTLIHGGHIVTAGATVVALGTLGLALGAIDPGLVGQTPPHPTLTGSVADALSILQNNLRVLAAPYLLWLIGFHTGWRAGPGDLLMFVVTAHSTLPVGIELARWHSRLLPYLPQLPLEWGALGVAVSAWLTIRTATATRRHVALLAGATAVLLLVAASLETWVTPLRTAPTTSNRLRVDGIQGGPLSCGRPGVAFATDFAPGRPGRCKVARSLPLTALGSARPNPGADRASSTTPGPPQGGTTT